LQGTTSNRDYWARSACQLFVFHKVYSSCANACVAGDILVYGCCFISWPTIYPTNEVAVDADQIPAGLFVVKEGPNETRLLVHFYSIPEYSGIIWTESNQCAEDFLSSDGIQRV
jgi:hypothetical protein